MLEVDSRVGAAIFLPTTRIGDKHSRCTMVDFCSRLFAISKSARGPAIASMLPPLVRRKVLCWLRLAKLLI